MTLNERELVNSFYLAHLCDLICMWVSKIEANTISNLPKFDTLLCLYKFVSVLGTFEHLSTLNHRLRMFTYLELTHSYIDRRVSVKRGLKYSSDLCEKKNSSETKISMRKLWLRWKVYVTRCDSFSIDRHLNDFMYTNFIWEKVHNIHPDSFPYKTKSIF